jgi:cytochrome c oxidase subunit 2
MERYERIFFWFSAMMLALFLCTLAYVTVFMHIHLPGRAGRILPKPGQTLAAAVLSTAPFNQPGLREIAPGRYEAVILAQQWIFYPRKIEIPGTRINVMVVPGYISVESYRFTHSGSYRILCHEYCGREHQTMAAEVIVK